MSNLSPIIYICYNRYEHVKKSLLSLKKNKLSQKSNIIIFSDAAQNYKDKKKILKIRNYLKNLKGFKSKKIIHRKKNFGTKKNIINAINFAFKKYDRAIIIEDDLIVSKYFLNFMNQCLEAYKNEKKIFHINGWSYPFMKKSSDDINFLGSMNCWGWATWKDRWSKLSLNEDKFISTFSNRDKHYFNISSSMNHWSQLLRNKNKTLSTWAVFWHASIFSKNGICIYPKFPLVKNIGFDGSGRMSSIYKYNSTLNNNSKKYKINQNIVKNTNLIDDEFNYYIKKKSYIDRSLTFLKKYYYKIFNL